ncbi:MAG: NADH:flavin oxidoreductase/NADH oxidase [Acidobacteria bacterium]|nr:NADH:flavin oxidoreductase/NADH oxidase [Acidobacteriota bacterium]
MSDTGSRPKSGDVPALFRPLKIRSLELRNRVAISPMCQNAAEPDGSLGDWHLVHLGQFALGGAGLVFVESTAVAQYARINEFDVGLWSDDHVAPLARVAQFVRSQGSALGVQLAHAGRKGSVHHPWDRMEDVPLTEAQGAWQTVAPSAIPFRPGWPVPREMTRADMDRVREAFAQATLWSDRAGFDLVELHMAHGYLLSSFVSPLSNQRTDDYGGSLRNRLRFPLEVFRAVRQCWPEHKPISVRISATDWLGDRGTTPEESVEFAKLLRAAGCDVIDVSSAGNSPESEPLYGRMYQVPFADKIRHAAKIPVMAVGALLGIDHANTVLAAGRADLAAMARPHLKDPYLTLHAAEHYELWDHPWPGPYKAVQPRPPKEE